MSELSEVPGGSAHWHAFGNAVNMFSQSVLTIKTNSPKQTNQAFKADPTTFELMGVPTNSRDDCTSDAKRESA